MVIKKTNYSMSGRQKLNKARNAVFHWKIKSQNMSIYLVKTDNYIEKINNCLTAKNKKNL